MFSVLYQVNVTDIVNKSSVYKFFYYYKSSKEKIRSSCCSRQNHYMTCKNKHISTTVLEEILLDLHHLARLAWLIQEYLILVKISNQDRRSKFN